MNFKTLAENLDMEENELKEMNPNIKAFLSNGYNIDGEAIEILKRSCRGVIQEPFDIKQLSKSIRVILDKKEDCSKETCGSSLQRSIAP